MKTITNADLEKAVAKRHKKIPKALDDRAIEFALIGGQVSWINAKDLFFPSRLEHVQVDASRVGVECSVSIEELFKAHYPVPVEQIKAEFFNGGFADGNTQVFRDGEHIKMRYESLKAKDIIEHIQEFIEDLEDRHERAVDAVVEANKVFGLNRFG